LTNDRCPWDVSLAEMPRIIVMPSMRFLLKKGYLYMLWEYAKLF